MWTRRAKCLSDVPIGVFSNGSESFSDILKKVSVMKATPSCVEKNFPNVLMSYFISHKLPRLLFYVHWALTSSRNFPPIQLLQTGNRSLFWRWFWCVENAGATDTMFYQPSLLPPPPTCSSLWTSVHRSPLPLHALMHSASVVRLANKLVVKSELIKLARLFVLFMFYRLPLLSEKFGKVWLHLAKSRRTSLRLDGSVRGLFVPFSAGQT